MPEIDNQHRRLELERLLEIDAKLPPNWSLLNPAERQIVSCIAPRNGKFLFLLKKL